MASPDDRESSSWIAVEGRCEQLGHGEDVVSRGCQRLNEQLGILWFAEGTRKWLISGTLVYPCPYVADAIVATPRCMDIDALVMF